MRSLQGDAQQFGSNTSGVHHDHEPAQSEVSKIPQASIDVVIAQKETKMKQLYKYKRHTTGYLLTALFLLLQYTAQGQSSVKVS